MNHSRQHSKHLLRVCYVPGIPHEKINKIELMSTKLQRYIQVTNLDYGECKIDSERREVICWLILSPEGLAKASQSSYHLIWVFKIKQELYKCYLRATIALDALSPKWTIFIKALSSMPRDLCRRLSEKIIGVRYDKWSQANIIFQVENCTYVHMTTCTRPA